MGRLLPWLAGAAGGLAAYRLVSRRRRLPAALPPAPAPDPAGGEPPGADPRAEELRAKLEARGDAPDAPDDLDARRADVHEQAHAAVERMRRAPGS